MTNIEKITNKKIGNLEIRNFHCSVHGYIKPTPTCPRCNKAINQTRQETLRDVERFINDETHSKGWSSQLGRILDFIQSKKENI